MGKSLYVLAPVLGALLLSIGSSVTAMPSATSVNYRLEEVQWVWLKADLNADGMLTRDEVWEEDATLATKFDDADFDGSGALNVGEFEILLMTS